MTGMEHIMSMMMEIQMYAHAGVDGERRET